MNYFKNFFKFLLKKIFGPTYILLIERIVFLIKILTGSSFSLNQIDKKLEKYLNFRNGYFVELGANDGIKQSNSLYFELKKNWKGVLVEPSPYNFQKCLQNRSKRNSIYCNACVGFDYDEKYVDMKYANLMSFSDNLNLDLRDKEEHLEYSKNFLNEDEIIFSYGARASTLNKLLEKAKAPKIIDFLSLDVEGAELEVLKGIDFEKFNFRYLLIESWDFKKVKSFLAKSNYFFIDQFSEHDFLFKNSSI